MITEQDIEVVQSDRDAAADLIEAQHAARGYAAGTLQTPGETRMGDRDWCPEVQAFARYRAILVERCAGVADEEVAARREDQKRDLLDNFLRGQLNSALRIAQQIRSLASLGGGV